MTTLPVRQPDLTLQRPARQHGQHHTIGTIIGTRQRRLARQRLTSPRQPQPPAPPKENDGLGRRFQSRHAYARARDSLTARNKNSLENRTGVRSPAFTVRDQWASRLTDPPQRRPQSYYSRISSGFKDNMLSAIWARRCDTPPGRRFHPPTPQISSAPVPASLRAPCSRRCLRP